MSKGNPTLLRSLKSPADLIRAAGLDIMGEALECVFDAMYACAPTQAQKGLWPSLSLQKWPTLKKKIRQVVGCIGRRGLKSSGLLAWTCLYELLCKNHDQYAAAGSRIYYVVICPRIPQAREALRAIKSALDQLASSPLGITYTVKDLAGTPEIVVNKPGAQCEHVITVQSADAVTVRGYAIAFLAFDEAAFLGSDEWLAQTDKDIVTAARAGQIQFPEARTLYTSSPGPDQGIFRDLVVNPPDDCLVVRAPSWVMNPRVSEAECRARADDDAVFEQEYAARTFGFFNANFIDAAALRACEDVDGKYTNKGVRPGYFVCGLDIGQKNDDTAIVILSCFYTEIRPGESIRHVTVEHLEIHKSDKNNPTAMSWIARRFYELCKLWKCGGVFDPFSAPSLIEYLEGFGMRDAKDVDQLRKGRFLTCGMSQTQQNPRWRLVRELCHGRRLHYAPDHRELAKQLAQLKATTQSSGALKVEGKKDDAADALALAASVAITLQPTSNDCVQVKYDRQGWSREQGYIVENLRSVKVLPNGREIPAPFPRWHPLFEKHARETIALGYSNSEIDAWLAEGGKVD